MKEIDQETNLERGRQEIWRRQKLLIAYALMFLPFGFLVMFPVEHFFGEVGVWIAFVVYGIVGFRIGHWFSNSPCPNCGRPIWIWKPEAKTRIRYRKCIHCLIDLRPTKQLNHLISFKQIPYEPGSIRDVEQDL